MMRDDEEEDELWDAVFTQGQARVYDRPTSIHHWQLRDLISAGDNETEFFCVYEQDVYKYNSKTHETTVIANLEFSANSMTYRHGFLAAGGLHGELEVRHLHRRPGGRHILFSGLVGTTVNNALHVGRASSGDLRLFVCANDSTIKVYALDAAFTWVTTIQCPCPINYAALSPDGATLVAVGDCEQTLLYKEAATEYAALTSFTEACDVGMCCAWSPHGSLAASCHQDGTVAMWDARSGACVAHTTLPSAARCIKFSATPLDMVAVSEHEERVHLVDARAWRRRQVLALGSGHNGVSGIAFTPSGGRLWVGAENVCVSADIDDVARRTFGAYSFA